MSKTRVQKLMCGLVMLLSAASVGCGDDGPMGTDSDGATSTTDPMPTTTDVPTTTTDPESFVGYVMNCDPAADPALDLLCINKKDWNCAHRDHYVRESLCALVHGGTPGDYDDKPVLVGIEDCANPPAGVVDAYSWVGEGCDDCRVCGNQLAGIATYQQGNPNLPGWDEHPWCPQNYNDLETFCEGGEMPDPTEGEPEEPPPSGIWICNGSTSTCGTMQDNIPATWMYGVCMAGNMGSPPDCVLATDVSNARDNCFDLCEEKDAALEMDAINNGWYWDNFLCGDLYNFPLPPVEATNPATQCSGGAPMGLVDPLPFTGEAVLNFFGGAYALSNHLSGVVDFSVGTCVLGICKVSLNELRLNSSDVLGVYHYVDQNNVPQSLPFTIEGLEVRTLQPAKGQLVTSTDAITFPTDNLYAVLSSSSTDLGANTINSGFEDRFVVIENLSGTWDGTELTLNIEWATLDGFLQFETQLTTN
ncbi:hypothetical protein SAMN02745121_01022 [Nannocystis exedens]|uniref:Uncharacterized protein n=2 Tax=Nannocystis exedens TaxID=54 RepID=A0A1I1UF48_9BACT|nr:hypothetical protein NAEX_04558 [Nannocystis exedens]SFD66580.1 hypothetical protein SAMN02745121_01022 [Nannocystis exedens]